MIWNKTVSLLVKTAAKKQRKWVFTVYFVSYWFSFSISSRPNSPEECKNNWTQTKAIFGGKIEPPPPPSSQLHWVLKERNGCEKQLLLDINRVEYQKQFNINWFWISFDMNGCQTEPAASCQVVMRCSHWILIIIANSLDPPDTHCNCEYQSLSLTGYWLEIQYLLHSGCLCTLLVCAFLFPKKDSGQEENWISQKRLIAVAREGHLLQKYEERTHPWLCFIIHSHCQFFSTNCDAININEAANMSHGLQPFSC